MMKSVAILISRKRGEKFQRKERVRNREDFLRLIYEGTRYHSKQYSLITVKNNLEYMRFAVSIKKNVGNSASRNYEKRLCREFFRREIIGQKKGFDVLIIIKNKSENYCKSYNALKSLFSRSLY